MFDYDEGWNPSNYEDEYDGEITFRRALAMSRNIATIHVAELAGFDNVAQLWSSIGVGTQPHAYPAITLGVFEASPFDIATAFTIFPNGGELRPLRVLDPRRRAAARTQPTPGRRARGASRGPTRRSS